MIKSLLFKRYNIIDLAGQGTAIWLVTKYDDYWWFFIILPFSILIALLESIERVNNGGKK